MLSVSLPFSVFYTWWIYEKLYILTSDMISLTNGIDLSKIFLYFFLLISTWSYQIVSSTWTRKNFLLCFSNTIWLFVFCFLLLFPYEQRVAFLLLRYESLCDDEKQKMTSTMGELEVRPLDLDVFYVVPVGWFEAF